MSSSTPLTFSSILCLLLFILVSWQQLPGSTARPVPESNHHRQQQHHHHHHHHHHHRHPWRSFEQFLDAQRGMNVTGMSQLKQYFHHFGYLPVANGSTDGFTDVFDERFESAVSLYQSKLGLNVNGKLDSATVSQITSPRCGVSDTTTTVTVQPHPSTIHAVKHFAFFPGHPTWLRPRPMTLTYAFSPYYSISYICQANIKAAFRRSFARWSAAIPVSFTETTDYPMADVRIGFYAGEHGDGEPFDGALGVLAHAFYPESGLLHLDAAETWAVDFDEEKASNAIDLESVATHEIGHILGLAHSSLKDSVMYPSIDPRTKKFDLREDDVEGVQALYGTNPKFRYGSSIQWEISHPSSSSAAASVRWWRSTVAGAAMMVVLFIV